MTTAQASFRAAALGGRVRETRAHRGYAVRELARRVGVSAATISAIENGRTGVSVGRLAELADALGVSPGLLLGDSRPIRTPLATSTRPRWRDFEPMSVNPVLNAAIAAFVETGYHGATMRAIADKARISIPGIYHHYASKQALLVRILDLTMDEIDWRLAEAVADVDAPLDRLARLVESLALFHTLRADLAFIGASEMRSVLEPDRSRIASRRSAVQHLIDDEIRRAVERGDATTTKSREAGRAIATMCTSLPQWFDLAGATSPESIASEYAEMAKRIIGAGHLTRSP